MQRWHNAHKAVKLRYVLPKKQGKSTKKGKPGKKQDPRLDNLNETSSIKILATNETN